MQSSDKVKPVVDLNQLREIASMSDGASSDTEDDSLKVKRLCCSHPLSEFDQL